MYEKATCDGELWSLWGALELMFEIINVTCIIMMLLISFRDSDPTGLYYAKKLVSKITDEIEAADLES